MVHVSSRGSRKETTNVDSGVQVDRLSAEVGSTSRAAAINGSQRVAPTLVTKLTKQVIDDTITTVGKGTVRSASVGGIYVVGGTIIALLTSIDDTITTERKLTVESATARESVGVERSSITNFTRINTSITALKLTARRATITVGGISIITSLIAELVNNTITALGDTTPRSAGIRFVGVGSTVVTLFQSIQNTITTSPQSAISSASVGDGIRIVDSVIAFLADIKETITANDLATLAVNVGGALITSLTRITNIIATKRKLTVETTSIGNSVGVSNTIITSLVGRCINHSVSAQ